MHFRNFMRVPAVGVLLALLAKVAPSRPATTAFPPTARLERSPLT